MKYVWEQGAWQDYLYWQSANRVIAQRVNALLKDIARNGNSGIGKPEQLRHGLQAQWSRRINEEHRLVYRISGDDSDQFLPISLQDHSSDEAQPVNDSTARVTAIESA